MNPLRLATVTDVVRRLTDTPYKMTCEAPSVLGSGMGDAQRDIAGAVDEAIKLGYVKVAAIRDTTYAGKARFLTLADNVAYCRTCLTGCDHGGHPDSDGNIGSCGHLGCWGPDATNDCAGTYYARTAVLGNDEWNSLAAQPASLAAV